MSEDDKTLPQQLSDIVGADKARDIISETRQLLYGTISDDDVAALIALAVLKVLNIGDAYGVHRVEFREDGWTIQHTLDCRADMFACPVTRAAQQFEWAPYELGVYACRVDKRGRFEILGRVDSDRG